MVVLGDGRVGLVRRDIIECSWEITCHKLFIYILMKIPYTNAI